MQAQRSSNAYVLDYDNVTFDARQAERKKTRALRQKKRRRVTLFIMLITLSIIFASSILILVRYVAITEATTKTNGLLNQYNSLVASNQQMSIEISKMMDTSKIEEMAITRLGMSRPEKYQIVYINVDKKDYVEFATKDIKTSQNGFLASISKSFGGLLEYLDL